jgi:hypothetical protein
LRPYALAPSTSAGCSFSAESRWTHTTAVAYGRVGPRSPDQHRPSGAHTLRCIGFSGPARVAAATGLSESDAESELIDLAVAGLVTHTSGEFGAGVSPKPAVRSMPHGSPRSWRHRAPGPR